MNEPTTALDVTIQAEVINLLTDLLVRFCLGFFLITHNSAVVRHIADRVTARDLGRIIDTEWKWAAFATPPHPSTLPLLSAVPRPAPGAVRAALPRTLSPQTLVKAVACH